MKDKSSKAVGAWRYIMLGGAGGLILIVLIVWGGLTLAISKGKPQVAQALARAVENESGRLPAESLALLRQMAAQAAEKQVSLAAVWLLSQSIGGAIADGKLNPEETRLLTRVRDFVSAAGGSVSFKEASAMLGAEPALNKLVEGEGLNQAPTTSTQTQ